MSRSGLFFYLLALLWATSALAGSLDKEMGLVEEVRGVRFLHEVDVVTISRADFRSYVGGQLEHGLGMPAESYFRVLRALQLIDTRSDPGEDMVDLYESQVLAFYDPETHRYYQIDTPPPNVKMPALFQNVVAVHEVMHAMQDQRFDAGEILDSLKNNWDAQLAYQSVLEGEATLVMYAALYKKLGKTVDDLIANDFLTNTIDAGGALDLGMPANAPEYFVESMKFPYLDGLKFVVEAYRHGGWKAVDDLHRRPPTSTAQIIDPKLYFDPECGDLTAPAAAKASRPIVTTQLGEFHWRFLVGDDAASGWEADSVTVTDGKRPTVLVETLWSNPDEAAAFATAYNRMLKKHGLDPKVRATGNQVRAAYGGDIGAIAAFMK